MKRKTAKDILAESFRELAEDRNIDRIRVKDITENCGYSTATFYRNFRDKYDLIAWDYTRDIKKILDPSPDSDRTLFRILDDASLYYESHKEYLANLLLHTSGYDSFVRYMTDINYGEVRERIANGSDPKKTGEKTDMTIRAYCLGTVMLTCEWILGRYDVSRETLRDVYIDSLPQKISGYLMK